MDLDPTIVIPAILFTVGAICFASSLLIKKSDASSAAARNKKVKVGYGDDVPPSRALGEQLRPEVSPRTEPPAPAEGIQDVPVKVEPEPVPEPVQEQEPVSDTVPEQVSAQEVAAVSEPVPEPELVPKPVEVPEPVEVSEPVKVPEPVEVSEPVEVPEPESESDPEPLVESELVPEVLPLVEEILPELIPRFAEEILLTPELLIETEREPEPEPEDFLNDDVAAAEDQVKFTPGKKQSKFETMMTKEEIEEEQSSRHQQVPSSGFSFNVASASRVQPLRC